MSTSSALSAAKIVVERCDALARYSESEGSITRTFLCAAMEEVHAMLRSWMLAAGLSVRTDRAGNIVGSSPAPAGAPRLLVGSHLDTVPNAGRYDGILGVLLGLALAERLSRKPLHIGLDVVGFSEEEGVRFSVPFVGSHAMAGSMPPHWLRLQDGEGMTLESALAAYAAAHPVAKPPALPTGAQGYLEFHIEQGPVLETSGQALAAVSAIAGQVRGQAHFRGRAGHAGTTPMTLRRDALVAAAEWISAVEARALTTTGLAASVGSITASPNAANVIAAEVRCTLDIRHAEDRVRDSALTELLTTAEAMARRRGVAFSWVQGHTQPAVAMDAALTTMAAEAIAATGLPATRMVSGAGHDAMILASRIPSTMIFLRSPGGLSHHPDEAVLIEDVSAALEAGWQFLLAFKRKATAVSAPVCEAAAVA